MIPALYDSNATVFGANGSPMAYLTDAISCTVEENLNDSYELTMEYSLDGIYAQYFINNENTIGGSVSYGKGAKRIIYAKPNPDDDPEPFRIYKISKPFNGVITISAAHISYDLTGIPVQKFNSSDINAALSYLKSNEIVASNFTYENVDVTSVKVLELKSPKSARAILGGSDDDSIIGAYGGELKYEKFKIKVYNRRGSDRGFKIRYGYNLLDLTDDYDCSECYSGVIPFYSAEDVLITGTTVVPTYTTDASLHEQELPTFTRVGLLDLSSYFESTPTVEQLTSKAQQYVQENNLCEPDINLSLSFAKLSDYDGYEDLKSLERVSLGDTVSVTSPGLGISRSKRVITTVYDVLRDRYDSIELGTPPKSLSGTLYDVISGNAVNFDKMTAYADAAAKEAKDYADLVSELVETRAAANTAAAKAEAEAYAAGVGAEVSAALSTAIQANTDLIKSVNGGYVVDHYNASGQRYEILIIENLYTLFNTAANPIVEWTQGNYPSKLSDGTTDARIWRWNSAGLGFSKTGYEGTYSTAITNTGSISGDFITTGTIDASHATITNINAGNITAGELDCSQITVKNLSANSLNSGEIDANDVNIKNIKAGNITSGTLNGQLVTINHLNASSIDAGTISASYISGGNLNASGSGGGCTLTNYATDSYPANTVAAIHFIVKPGTTADPGRITINDAVISAAGITHDGTTINWSQLVNNVRTAVFG